MGKCLDNVIIYNDHPRYYKLQVVATHFSKESADKPV